jgi:uncharacterized protein (DUF302 family)
MSFGVVKEASVSSVELADAELLTMPSASGALETVRRLRLLLAQKKIQIFADIDHAANAEKAGLSLRPTRLLIFGNAEAGTPLMQSQQTMGLDLPLRALVWEDAEGKVWVTCHRPALLALRHHVLDQDEAVQRLDAGLAAMVRAATSE